jgi:hypothetical protein
MTSRFRPLLLLLFAGLLAAGSAWAKKTEAPPAPPRDGNGNAGPSNLPESVRRVERQTGGEVLRAEPMQRDGREVYRVKVLTSDGRVRVIQDDPQQGRRSDEPQRGGNRGRERSEERSGDDDQSDDPSQ